MVVTKIRYNSGREKLHNIVTDAIVHNSSVVNLISKPSEVIDNIVYTYYYNTHTCDFAIMLVKLKVIDVNKTDSVCDSIGILLLDFKYQESILLEFGSTISISKDNSRDDNISSLLHSKISHIVKNYITVPYSVTLADKIIAKLENYINTTSTHESNEVIDVTDIGNGLVIDSNVTLDNNDNVDSDEIYYLNKLYTNVDTGDNPTGDMCGDISGSKPIEKSNQLDVIIGDKLDAISNALNNVITRLDKLESNSTMSYTTPVNTGRSDIHYDMYNGMYNPHRYQHEFDQHNHTNARNVKQDCSDVMMMVEQGKTLSKINQDILSNVNTIYLSRYTHIVKLALNVFNRNHIVLIITYGNSNNETKVIRYIAHNISMVSNVLNYILYGEQMMYHCDNDTTCKIIDIISDTVSVVAYNIVTDNSSQVNQQILYPYLFDNKGYENRYTTTKSTLFLSRYLKDRQKIYPQGSTMLSDFINELKKLL